LEILKRARGVNDGELTSYGRPTTALKDEVNLRTYKAGYTDRDGQPKISRNSKAAGKGDVPRPVNKKKYNDGYRKAFGHD
jgi:hypothetical protein